MITLTDKEIATISAIIREIQKEDRRPVRRRNRISNLSGKISFLLRKAERRGQKEPTIFDSITI